MKRVACYLAPGFEETEALMTIDILRRANVFVDIISINEKQVLGAHQIEVVADKLWDEQLINYDMIFLPGGQPGTNNLMADERVIENVQAYYEDGKLVAAICAAPLVLDKAGLLVGKKITSYPGVSEGNFIQSDYVEDPVVVDGNIITSRGVATVAQFAWTLLKELGIDPTPYQESMLFK